MVGMLQILTYLLAFYLVVKGLEIVQISLASNRPHRAEMIAWSILVLIACIAAAIGFVALQEYHVASIGKGGNDTIIPSFGR